MNDNPVGTLNASNVSFLAQGSSLVVPAIVADAGARAAGRFVEFFAATIRNRNTRLAYGRDVGTFLAWCEDQDLTFDRIGPVIVASCVEQLLPDGMAKPSVKQHLAAFGNPTRGPLWRSMTKERSFGDSRMNRVDVFRMVKHRCTAANMGGQANCHIFRATGITAYLLNGGRSKGHKPSPHMKARAQRSSTTGRLTKLRSPKLSESASSASDPSAKIEG